MQTAAMARHRSALLALLGLLLLVVAPQCASAHGYLRMPPAKQVANPRPGTWNQHGNGLGPAPFRWPSRPGVHCVHGSHLPALLPALSRCSTA